MRPAGSGLVVLGAMVAIATGSSQTAAAAQIPDGLVLDVRLVEARSLSPDFRALENLGFFIDTDGRDVRARQWLATLSRKIPDSFLAALAAETLPAGEGKASFALSKRSRRLELGIDLENYVSEGSFTAPLRCRRERGDRVLEEFTDELELTLNQTYVTSSRDLELSTSDYLSHFRDYDDAAHREALYQELRSYNIFLILAITPRLVSESEKAIEDVALTLPAGTEMPEVRGSLRTRVNGTMEIGFEVGNEGQPINPQVLRSSIPEANVRILGEVSEWRFPDAIGKRGRLSLDVTAEP